MKTAWRSSLAGVMLWTGSLYGAMPEPPPPSALHLEYISEIIRYLYSWHMDETMLANTDNITNLEVWVRPLHPKLDADDHSEFYEVLIPGMLYRVRMKKADYPIPELGIQITNQNYKIIAAERLDARPALPPEAEKFSFGRQYIMDYLFRTRNDRQFPNDALLERMKAVVSDEFPVAATNTVVGPQTVYLAPISPVSNDLWLFWETQRILIRFSSDADLKSETYWMNKKLDVRFYDLDQHVVVSLAEVAGSNAFVTRDWAARVLFNCVVNGKKIIVEPQPDQPSVKKAADDRRTATNSAAPPR